ncbi:ribosomal protein S12 (apicoplast) [Theileria orientalis]|uniref:Ribosomal protein S12 n=1 Tax=Theileria orientalis TaxID=68886 RepID=A0A976SJX4_THEOR|nr:ribosomal protein S12 [Theileria orientalis]
MTTLNQSIKRKKIKKNKKTILNNSPQIKGLLLSTVILSPKKPNSAKRKVALVKLKNGKKIKAYIPGEKSILKDNNKVLIRGGNTKDLPGVNYKVVLGVFNNYSLEKRLNKRSKYGVSLLHNS